MKELFLNSGIIENGILSLTSGEAYRNCTENKAVILDIREGYINAFKQFDVPECISLPFKELKGSSKHLPTDRLLIAADSTGIYSKEAVEYLIENGFTTVAHMSGGFVGWERSNLPIHIDTTNRLSGSCMCQLKYRENKRTKL